MMTDLMNSPATRLSVARRLGVLASSSLAMLLLLSGCSNAPKETPQNPGTAAVEQLESSQGDENAAEMDAGTVTASINGREFTFALTRCTMYQGSEVELAGPGNETGSDVPSYLDGGLMQMDADVLGEFRISIGTDQPFDSTNEFLSLGAPTGEGLTVVKDGDGYLATANAWNNQGTDLGTGTLHLTCR